MAKSQSEKEIMTNTRNESNQNGGRKDMTIKKGLYVRRENNVALGSPKTMSQRLNPLECAQIIIWLQSPLQPSRAESFRFEWPGQTLSGSVHRGRRSWRSCSEAGGPHLREYGRADQRQVQRAPGRMRAS